MEWQPIETAPKDGTFVLVIAKGFVPSVARYCMDERAWLESDRSEDDEDIDWNSQKCWHLTHWMYLPKQPKE